MTNSIGEHSELRQKCVHDGNQEPQAPTLNGPLSVLNSIPGTYFSQTGNPLCRKQSKWTKMVKERKRRAVDEILHISTRSSTQHKHKVLSEDEHTVLIVVSAWWTWLDYIYPQNNTDIFPENERKKMRLQTIWKAKES